MTELERISAILTAETPDIDWCQECGGFRETPDATREAWITRVAGMIANTA